MVLSCVPIVGRYGSALSHCLSCETQTQYWFPVLRSLLLVDNGHQLRVDFNFQHSRHFGSSSVGPAHPQHLNTKRGGMVTY